MINLVPVSAVLAAESGGRPATVIDTTDHDVIGYWACRLNVSRDDLVSAIEKVGNSVAAVRRRVRALQPAHSSAPSVIEDRLEHPGVRSILPLHLRRRQMRSLILAGLSVATILTGVGISTVPASAYDYPYCLQGKRWGYPGNCQFSTYEQCQVTASGTDDFCGVNPRAAFRRQPPSYR